MQTIDCWSQHVPPRTCHAWHPILTSKPNAERHGILDQPLVSVRWASLTLGEPVGLLPRLARCAAEPEDPVSPRARRLSQPYRHEVPQPHQRDSPFTWVGCGFSLLRGAATKVAPPPLRTLSTPQQIVKMAEDEVLAPRLFRCARRTAYGSSRGAGTHNGNWTKRLAKRLPNWATAETGSIKSRARLRPAGGAGAPSSPGSSRVEPMLRLVSRRRTRRVHGRAR